MKKKARSNNLVFSTSGLHFDFFYFMLCQWQTLKHCHNFAFLWVPFMSHMMSYRTKITDSLWSLRAEPYCDQITEESFGYFFQLSKLLKAKWSWVIFRILSSHFSLSLELGFFSSEYWLSFKPCLTRSSACKLDLQNQGFEGHLAGCFVKAGVSVSLQDISSLMASRSFPALQHSVVTISTTTELFDVINPRLSSNLNVWVLACPQFHCSHHTN